MKLIRPMAVTDAVLTSSSVAEDDFTAWNVGTTYAAGAKVRRVAADVHLTFESAVGSNLGNDPLADASGEFWITLGPTNRWAMFDPVIQTQTTADAAIAVELDLTGRIDTVALQNVSAASVQVTMTDAVEGVVYDRTVSLISTDGIVDAYSYCFEPVARLRDLTLLDLPPYGNASLEVTLSEGGGQVACGLLLVGLSRELGGTLWGATAGIRDFSTKATDDLGRFGVVKRAYSKRASFQILVPNAAVDTFQNTLADYRATPVLYVGDGRFASLAVFGFYRDFNVEVAYPDRSLATLDIEGLT